VLTLATVGSLPLSSWTPQAVRELLVAVGLPMAGVICLAFVLCFWARAFEKKWSR